MSEFVRFTLDDGSEVLFESAESDLVALHGGAPEVRDGGKLTARLQGVAEAAEEVAGSLRARLAPDEVSLEFGLKVSLYLVQRRQRLYDAADPDDLQDHRTVWLQGAVAIGRSMS